MRDLRRYVPERVLVLSLPEPGQPDGETFEGILAHGDSDWLTLTDAGLLETGPDGTTTRTPLDGTVLIPRHRVSWVQVPEKAR